MIGRGSGSIFFFRPVAAGEPSVDQVRPSFESLLVSSALTAEGGKAFDHRLAGFLSPLSLDGQKVEYRTATSSRKMAIPT
jgi:hypothetical protein